MWSQLFSPGSDGLAGLAGQSRGLLLNHPDFTKRRRSHGLQPESTGLVGQPLLLQPPATSHAFREMQFMSANYKPFYHVLYLADVGQRLLYAGCGPTCDV